MAMFPTPSNLEFVVEEDDTEDVPAPFQAGAPAFSFTVEENEDEDAPPSLQTAAPGMAFTVEEEEDEDEPSAIGTFFRELAGPTLLGGARDALQSVLDLPEDFGITGELPDLPEVADPTTAGGLMARSVTQFLVGFIPIFGWLGKAGKLGTVARGALAGAAADFAVFDGQEERLSNLIQEYPSLANPVTEFLAADAEDSAIVGRLKSMGEGVLVGGLLDGFLAGLRSIKAARAGRKAVDAGAAPEVVKEAIGNANRPQTSIERVAQPSVDPADLAPGTPTSLTPEELLRPTDLAFETRAAGRTAESPTREVRVAGNINLDRIDANEEIKSALTLITEEQGGFEAARAAGREAGEEHTRAVRELQLAMSARTMDLTRRASQGASDVQLAEWAAVMEQQAGVMKWAAGQASESSARLRTYKEIKNALGKADFKAIRRTVEQMGGRDALEHKAMLLSTIDDLEGFGKQATKIWEATRMDKALEVWRAGLLTGLRTQFANIGSNALVTSYAIPERIIGAAFGRMSAGERIYFRESAAFANGALKAMQKATSDAWQVFWREGQDLGALPSAVRKNVPFLKEDALPSGITKSGEVGRRHAVAGAKGYVTRSVFRALDAGDVWFKTINFAGETEALALRKAIKEGVEGPALKERVAEILSDLPDDIIEAANKRADTNTFTTPLHQQEGVISGLAESISKFSGKHPSFGFIAPFIRTPANIFKFALERTPGGFFMKDMQTALKSPGPARQEALAKITLGSSFMATAMWHASQGNITGNGPTDPAKRKWWREDHQPYSVKIKGKWYSYARFEPLGTLMGIAADGAQIWERLGAEDYDKMAMMFAISAANVMTSKTFMQGPVGLIEALNDPERFGDRFIESLAASTVPTIVADVAKAQDPVLRNARGVVDAWMNRVPGLSGRLEPVLNRWGEEIVREGGAAGQMLSPVYVSDATKDPLANEILRLDMAPGMPRREINGHDLTPEQYTEYVKLSGKPAKKMLEQMISDSSWTDIPASVQRDLIDSRIQLFARIARMQMIAEYPEMAVPKEVEELQSELAPLAPPVEEKEALPWETSERTPAQSEFVAASVGLAPWLTGSEAGSPVSPEEIESQIETSVRAVAGADTISLPPTPEGIDTEDTMRIAANPDAWLAKMLNEPGTLAAKDPEGYAAQVAVAQRASAALLERLPASHQAPGEEDSDTPHLADYEIERWATVVQAVTSPMTVLKQLERGEVDSDAISALRDVYPALFARVQVVLASELAGKPDAFAQRIALADLLPSGMEPTLQPGFVAAMQQTFAETDPEQGMPGSYGMSRRNSSETLTPRQQRRKSRNISLSMSKRMGGGEQLMTPIGRLENS